MSLSPTLRALSSLAAHLGGAPPPDLDATEKELLFSQDKLSLRRVRPRAGAPAPLRTPVLLIPPLMVQPYVYDLAPHHSLLVTLRDAGLDPFVIDFGVPDRGDAGLTLDDYVLDFVPTCIERTLQASGAEQLAVVGYCMGGLFGLIHAGTFRDDRVCALVTIGAPVNFQRMGVVTVASRLGAPVIDPIIDLLGNVPGWLSSGVFKAITGPQLLKGYLHLLTHLSDEEQVAAFRAINYWINDLIPFPQEAFRQVFHEIVFGDKLRRGELVLGGRRCDLGAVTCPLLTFAGETDRVAPHASIREIMELVGSSDKTLVLAPGGHAGVMAGSRAPQAVWQPLTAWLTKHLAQQRRI
jgi:poly[(R)-3-hydroxyalkanoate] polymerase subunit PhaC